MKDVMLLPVMAAAFQNGLQFCLMSIKAFHKYHSAKAYKRIVFIVTGLRYQNAVVSRGSFDEVMRAHICHNLRARINLGAELLLDLLDGLYGIQLASKSVNASTHVLEAYPLIKILVHPGDLATCSGKRYGLHF
jgi:hypothetical protein